MSRSRWSALSCGVALTALSLTAPATAEPSSTPAAAAGSAEAARSAPSAEPVRETVWVETGLDSNRDGHPDRVAADIARPAQQGRAPVIMDASPYYSCCGRGNEDERKTYDEQGRPLGFPLFYDNHFVPRGYATVLVDLAGTNRSQGCSDVGGPSDIASAKAVIDWLNGRARGFDAPSGGRAVNADWSSGNVGMIGKSYDGTIANGVAATGVEGLRTIVPIGGISSWYDYYRSDGVSSGSDPVELANTVERGGRPDCDQAKRQLANGAPANGDTTPMWAERDYVPDAGNVHASVFAVHGLNDLNVKTVHFGQWWHELAQRGVPRKTWLSQTGHVDPFDFRRREWVETLTRWFDHWLRGADDGIEREPVASVERAPDQWSEEADWGGERATPSTLRPRPGAVGGLGALGMAPAPPGSAESFTDDPKRDEYDWAARPDQPAPDRALFSSAPLRQDLRLAGTGSIRVTARPTTPSAHLSAALVDYGPATTRDYLGPGEGIRTLDHQSCWGASRPGDGACYRDTEATKANVDNQIISRGWADLGNHASLSHQEPLEPGRSYDTTFRLSTTDHVIPAGHRVGVIIAGTDSAFITPPRDPGCLDVGLDGTAITVPAVGGDAAVARAGLTASPASPPVVRPDRAPRLDKVQLNGDTVRREP